MTSDDRMIAEAPGEELSSEDRAFLERIARWLARRTLAVPAILFLESVKPLTFVGSQTMFFFEPMVKIFVGGAGYTRFARIMEDRAHVEVFLRAIETADHDIREERKREERKKEK
jgi:hypothetical protein